MLQARVVRLLGADDPVEGLEYVEAKRIRSAEAMARWRARHPDLVKMRNAEQYMKARAKILAKKRAVRRGPAREAFLERARAANRRYYAKNKERITAELRARRRASRRVRVRSESHPWRKAWSLNREGTEG